MFLSGKNHSSIIIKPKPFLKAESGTSGGKQGTSQVGMEGLLWSFSSHHMSRNSCLNASRRAASLVQDKRTSPHTFMDSSMPRVLQWLWFLWHTPVGMIPNSSLNIVTQMSMARSYCRWCSLVKCGNGRGKMARNCWCEVRISLT